jgi:hypothetical protein
MTRSAVGQLYPLVLTGADIGLGLVLYESGILAFAVVLWLAALATCFGVVAAAQSVEKQGRPTGQAG